MTGTNLPDAQTLIAAARKAMTGITGDSPEAGEQRREAASRALDRWAPAIDELTDYAGAARFLGLAVGSVRRMKGRTLADGTRQWPEPDGRFGASPAWRYRTIVIGRARSPGHGHRGATLGRTNAHKRRHDPAG